MKQLPWMLLKKRRKNVVTKRNEMVVDIFHNETLQCVRNVERFAIFTERRESETDLLTSLGIF